MKKNFNVLALLLFFAPAYSQTLFIANSNPGAVGGTNVYLGANAINSAIASAVAGDIIYVVPSGVTYSGVVLNKSVTIIGGGFNPDKQGGNVTTLSSVNVSANNVRISGLHVMGDIYFSGSFSNIMIDKCRFRSASVDISSGLSNVIIQNCIAGEDSPSAFSLFLQNASSNVRISNNILYCPSNFSGSIRNLNGATVENNVLIGYGLTGGALAFDNVSNCNIQNNIFFAVSPAGTATFSNNDFNNNLSFGSSSEAFSVDNGNTSTANITGQDPLFINLPAGTSYSFNYDPSLQTGSPARGAGVDGVDMGLFGGLNPFDVYGTSLPLVQKIITPNTNPQGTNMNVRVQAKGN